MTYNVKEIFLTIQGEGVHSGRVAVFCRFSGCNLWSGLEKDRSNAACKFCDTDFIGTNGINGGKYASANELVEMIDKQWPSGKPNNKYVVFTGGEPLLQLDLQLITAIKKRGFMVAIETNGTLRAPEGVDWICVSPKTQEELVQNFGDELKLVYPQAGLEPCIFEELDFKYFLIQPMDGDKKIENTKISLSFCLNNPSWALSTQTHKYLDIP